MSDEKKEFRISRIFGAYYEIYSQESGSCLAQLKGKLRLESRKERHPFVVGDRILAERSGETWVIVQRLERSSILLRKSSNKEAHSLCANADYAVVIASLAEPETKVGFIDRVIASVSGSGMLPVLVFTKKDLVSEEEWQEKVGLYSDLGFQTFCLNSLDEDSIVEVRNFLKGKVSFLTGNSGVGKSTLLNALSQTKVQSTQKVSETTHKGRHTTTNSFAMFLEDGTVLIDSPGIKEWGILHLTEEEIRMSFPELQEAQKECNLEMCCTWDSDCPVQAAIQKLPEIRAKSLESMIQSLDQPFRTTRRDHWNRAESGEFS
jgi:ribosome biogenesis GTPase